MTLKQFFEPAEVACFLIASGYCVTMFARWLYNGHRPGPASMKATVAFFAIYLAMAFVSGWLQTPA